MEVVLRQDVDKLGLRGEVVQVARGYARNYLLPRGLAEPATPGLLRELDKREAQRARHEAKSTDEARAIAKRLEALELRFDVKAGPTGTLFGSVTATNVADRLWETEKIRIDRRKLQLDTIKHVGRYTVPVEVFTDVSTELRLVVAPPGVELPTEEESAAAAAAEAEATAAAEAAVEAEAAPAAEEPVEAPAAEPEAQLEAEPADAKPAAADAALEAEAEPEPEQA
jgi:large subunit ribosomal protein L9